VTGGDRIDGFRNQGEAVMRWFRFTAVLLSSVVLAASATFARADCGSAAPAGDCGGCAPATRTISVTEWVPEHYQACRTVYKQECVQEKYTGCRTECVAEQRTHQVTVYKSVCETHNECRTICKCIPYCEDRTVMKQVVTCCPETTYTHKCVDKGHYECREVACGPTLSERFHKLCKHHKRNECCESACESQCCEAPRTRTERVWVSCKVDECVPCTHMVRHCSCVPTVEHVTCYKHVSEQITVPVSCFHCVPECVTKTCTVMVPHQVTFEGVRNVTRCVPVQETYTACRMVSRCVEKQVACEAVSTSCCGSTSCCENQGGHHGFHMGGRMKGLFHHNSCGCESTCGGSCNSGCGCN
jgi:hypothetical protein